MIALTRHSTTHSQEYFFFQLIGLFVTTYLNYEVKQISSIRPIWVDHRHCAHPKMKSYTCVTSRRRKSARKFKHKLLRQATKNWTVTITDIYMIVFRLSEFWMWFNKLEIYICIYDDMFLVQNCRPYTVAKLFSWFPTNFWNWISPPIIAGCTCIYKCILSRVFHNTYGMKWNVYNATTRTRGKYL